MKTIISRKTKNKSTWKFPTGYGYTMFLFAVLLALMISSCSKNELLEKNPGNDHFSGFHKSGLDLSGVELLDGILRFEDVNIYNSVIDQLDEACDDYWDYILEMILSEYGELEDDEFNDIIDQLAIHEDQPLIDFEEIFPEFYSLRKHLELLEIEWLEQEDPTEPDPDDHDIFDDAERTVHNSLGEIIIGTDIFKVYPSGTRIVIKNLDFELLEMINGMDTLGLDTLRHPNFEFWYKCGQQKEPEWCYDRHDVKEKLNVNDRAMKMKFKIDNWPAPSSYLKGKVKNYKKKSNGKWKTFNTNTEILFKGGPVYNNDCEHELDLDPKHFGKKKKKLKGKYPLPKNAPNIKSGEHSALFKGALDSHQLTLEW